MLSRALRKIGEVTSWLLHRAEDLDPRQQLLASLCAHAPSLTASPST
jgi:hypothetical protein